MKNRHQIILGCMTALISLTPLVTNAQSEDLSRHSRTHTSITEKLDLTDAQKEKIAELHKEARAMREEHIQKIKMLRKQTKEELLKENPSRIILSELARETGELERVHTEKQHEHLLKTKEILTPEQFTELINRDKHIRFMKNDGSKRMMRQTRSINEKSFRE